MSDELRPACSRVADGVVLLPIDIAAQHPAVPDQTARGGAAKAASTADPWCLARLHDRESGVLRDGEIEIGVRIRLVVERVMPPLALVRTETASLHEGTQVLPVPRFGRCD